MPELIVTDQLKTKNKRNKITTIKIIKKLNSDDNMDLSVRRRRNLHATTPVAKPPVVDPQSTAKQIQNTPNQQSTYFLTRIVLTRFIAFIYAIAFLIAYNQNIGLLGKNGLKPANRYMQKIDIEFQKRGRSSNPLIVPLGDAFQLFLNLPTFFWFFNYTAHIDQLLTYTSIAGCALSVLVLTTGRANSLIMFTLWLLYHGIVNVGQTWYSFGWESQLLESGFIAIFLVPVFSLNMTDPTSPPSFIPILLYRWLIFRIMLGAVNFPFLF